MRTANRRTLQTCLLVATLASSGLVLGQAMAATPAATIFSLHFDDLGSARTGTGALVVENGGSSEVDTKVSAAGGGALRTVARKGGGYAARFPTYATNYRQRVVVTATSPAGKDALSPGTRNFTFGADFTLDKVSEGSAQDNGNNLVQRGLFADPGQYKIQIDHAKASCRVAGKAGAVFVRSTTPIKPATWYRVSCSRTQGGLTLAIGTVDGVVGRTWSAGATGVVDAADSTPLALGGKVSRSGRAVAGNSDQFNGAMDNVFLRLDR